MLANAHLLSNVVAVPRHLADKLSRDDPINKQQQIKCTTKYIYWFIIFIHAAIHGKW